MQPLSRDAIGTLVQALNRYQTGIMNDIKQGPYSDAHKADLQHYLTRVGLIWDELEEHYNACRAEHPDMMPMDELIRGIDGYSGDIKPG